MVQQYQAEIRGHFAAEEQVLFPAARAFSSVDPIVDELLADHELLRASFAKAEAQQMSAEELLEFARKLSEHIRKEERQLFERMQELMKADELNRIGKELDEALRDATQICALPNPKK